MAAVMDPKLLGRQITGIAAAARADGQYVDIDFRLPTVAVHLGPDPAEQVFFQGDEADTLLKDAESAAARFDCGVEDVILCQAQEWM